MAQLPFQAQRLSRPETAAQRCGMCRQPVPAGQCCCDRCHAAGWSILFYSGVGEEHFDAELWLPARGFEDSYDVSTFGRVRNRRTGRILVASGRYPSVRLGGRTVAVHRLMGETYLGGARSGQVVLHDDDDKTNLWIANLRYGSHSDNLRDAHRHGVRNACARAAATDLWATTFSSEATAPGSA
ncbi:HNH endonuclease [Mycobacterium sp. 1423905.2]|uniref:HNH endonuclease n=1 Tax=Mycobacterium sp. 1423905.2 TaxID=1856859 RepID=UPI0020A26646|nr:HNH endonuclease [Mycobacterium sp. 1423905.2]